MRTAIEALNEAKIRFALDLGLLRYFERVRLSSGRVVLLDLQRDDALLGLARIVGGETRQIDRRRQMASSKPPALRRVSDRS